MPQIFIASYISAKVYLTKLSSWFYYSCTGRTSTYLFGIHTNSQMIGNTHCLQLRYLVHWIGHFYTKTKSWQPKGYGWCLAKHQYLSALLLNCSSILGLRSVSLYLRQSMYNQTPHLNSTSIKLTQESASSSPVDV